jgi:hypothetical protein
MNSTSAGYAGFAGCTDLNSARAREDKSGVQKSAGTDPANPAYPALADFRWLCGVCRGDYVNPPLWMTCAGCFPKLLATLPKQSRAAYAATYGPPGFRATTKTSPAGRADGGDQGRTATC